MAGRFGRLVNQRVKSIDNDSLLIKLRKQDPCVHITELGAPPMDVKPIVTVASSVAQPAIYDSTKSGTNSTGCTSSTTPRSEIKAFAVNLGQRRVKSSAEVKSENRGRRLAKMIREERNTIVVHLMSGVELEFIVESPDESLFGLYGAVTDPLKVKWWCVDLVRRHNNTVVPDDCDLLDLCGQTFAAVIQQREIIVRELLLVL